MSLNRFWVLMTLLAIVTAGIYFANPGSTASFDPRARLFGFALYSIPSEAMSPTLKSGDNILVKTFVYIRRGPTVGDVVAYKRPQQNIPFIGRIMGAEGDRVSVINSIVHINGLSLTETYIATPGSTCALPDFKETTVPNFSVFILGDNRCNSFDSRSFGFVPGDRIIGQASFIWYSPEKSRVGKIQ